MRSNLLVPMVALVLNAACVAALAQTPTYNLGRTPSAEEIRAVDIIVGPAGKELPPGRGTAKEGANIYARRCAACHGPTGTAKGDGVITVFKPLVGGKGTLNTLHPVWTLGSLPFATTIWDFINRVMPYNDPGSLSADEVYAVTAFLLYRNDIIQESDILDAKSLPKIPMPNRNGFVPARLEDILDLPKRGCRGGTCP